MANIIRRPDGRLSERLVTLKGLFLNRRHLLVQMGFAVGEFTFRGLHCPRYTIFIDRVGTGTGQKGSGWKRLISKKHPVASLRLLVAASAAFLRCDL